MVVHAMGSTYAKDFGDFKFVTAVDLKKLLLLLLHFPIFWGVFLLSPLSNTFSCAVITTVNLERLEVLGHGNDDIICKVRHKWTLANYIYKLVQGHPHHQYLSFCVLSLSLLLRSCKCS
ncbi:hypothetical protein ACFX19_041773 [Malus domestica]